MMFELSGGVMVLARSGIGKRALGPALPSALYLHVVCDVFPRSLPSLVFAAIRAIA